MTHSKEVTIQFGGLGQNHFSVTPLSAGNFKKLALLMQGALPSDLPKGFAEWLIDGELKKDFGDLITAQLKYWRSRCFDIEFVAENRVPPNLGGTLKRHFLNKGPAASNPLVYEGRETAPWSTWDGSTYPNQEEQRSFYYKVVTIDRSLIQQLVGDDYRTAREWALTPLQVYDILCENIVAYDDRDYLFFMGYYDSSFPLFMRAWCKGGSNLWRIREEILDSHGKGIENVYLVFGKRLPSQ